MNRIIAKEQLAQDVYRVRVAAPLVISDEAVRLLAEVAPVG